MNREQLGWNDFFGGHFSQYDGQEFIPARIAREDRERYLVYCELGELSAEVSGKLRHRAISRADYPAVGDWVAIRAAAEHSSATIQAILPRRSKFSRKAVLSGGNPSAGGKTDEQILAANIDTIFLVSGLDLDYNLRRIERYLTIAWDSGANPVIVLNKSDLCDDLDARLAEISSAAIGVPVHAIAAKENRGLEALEEYFTPGITIALLGSSGVGKSTIINSLLGTEQMLVQETRAGDNHGRHTTTHRELIVLPGGGLVIDTPGMRMLEIWSDEQGLENTFGDIESIAANCRFRDCQHQDEPGCAIRQALADETLDAGRYANYCKLQREVEFLAKRQDKGAQRRANREWQKMVTRQSEERRRLFKQRPR